MIALDLIVLGRQLAKIGESVMRGAPSPWMPTSVGLVLRDVLAHPGSSISDITARTAMPQSHVSETVAQLVEQGLLETARDPADKRRTLVQVAKSHPRHVARAGTRSADAALIEALGDVSSDAARDLIATLEEVASRLRPKRPGPILDQLNRARRDLSGDTDPNDKKG